MAKATATVTNATKETKTTDEPVEQQLDADQLAVLQAEKRRIDEAIKAAKANLPKLSALEKEIARQAKPSKWFTYALAQMVRRRIRCGQSYEEAMEGVLALVRGFI